MPATQFNKARMAQLYARRHSETDSGIRHVFFLPTCAPEREIRLIEVNELTAEFADSAIEPIDFCIDRDTDTEHMLVILDLTPGQWDRMQQGLIRLPAGWSMDDVVDLTSQIVS